MNVKSLLSNISVKNINIADLYIAGWCLYYLQGTWYSEGSILSVSLLILLLCISIYYVIYSNIVYHLPVYFKGLNLLLIMFTCYGIISMISGSDIVGSTGSTFASKSYLQQIYLSLLPVYTFYVFSIQGYITRNRIAIWIFAFIYVARASYYHFEEKTGLQTNNASYIFLSIIPATLLLRRYILLQYLALAYCFMFTMAGLKRGAMLLGFIMIALIIADNFIHSKRNGKVLVLIIVAIFSIFCFRYLSNMSEHRYFQERMQETMEGKTSGRDNLYGFFWNHYVSQESYQQLLFGGGADTTRKIYTNLAHNDWLELLTNQGLLGVSFYLFYWICFIFSWLRVKNNDGKIVLGMIFLIYFFRTLVSMSYADMSFYATCILGYYLSKSHLTDLEIKQLEEPDEE